jgi:high affinity Mn2+ porin
MRGERIGIVLVVLATWWCWNASGARAQDAGSATTQTQAAEQTATKITTLATALVTTPVTTPATALVTAPATTPATTQEPAPISSGDPASDETDAMPAMFPHPETDRIWISGQANIISQWHPAFHSPYQGPHSLTPEAQDATSRVLTLYTGLRLTSTTEFLCDVQETGGHGIGEALGLAGATNLDVVRNPALSKAPYIARLMWHQIIPLGGARQAQQRNQYALFSTLPERRLEVRFGKFSLADFFDNNTYGTDTNLQFMNWTVDNNGAYDYAADTRGYTFAAMVEYHDKFGVIRFAEALMPKVANGIHLDADLSRARAENLEVELHGHVGPLKDGILRLETFVNHANMGVYQEAINNFLAGQGTAPDITAHPLQTTVKYGFGINFEQPLNDWIGVFGRWGWNEGQHESYAYTEVDQTDQIGVGGNGKRWGRKYDRIGLVFVSNGISRVHAEYLALGGEGFLLGDGRLNYGREKIVEGYYTLHLWKGFYPAFGVQHINNPGYNRDRGPVVVPTLRAHVEF